jgi:hypothetical protein
MERGEFLRHLKSLTQLKAKRADLRFELETARVLAGVERRGDLSIRSVCASSESASKAVTIPVKQLPLLPAAGYALRRRQPTGIQGRNGAKDFMTDMIEKVRAKITQKSRLYIHNDLSNAAFHFKETIDAKEAAEDRMGITYEYMACAMMLAFTFEAKLNFMGWKLIPDWKEFQPFYDKAEQVFERLGLELDWTNRPLSSLKEMKRFRDMIAHGKPIVIERDEIVVMKAEELDRRVSLKSPWQDGCTPHLVNLASDDLAVIWHRMLEASGLEIFDTMTSGEGGVLFIEKVMEPAATTTKQNPSSPSPSTS